MLFIIECVLVSEMGSRPYPWYVTACVTCTCILEEGLYPVFFDALAENGSSTYKYIYDTQKPRNLNFKR